MGNKLIYLTLVMVTVFILSLLSVYIIPWYVQELPFKIHGRVFKPGQQVTVEVERRALIDLHGLVVLELVRVEKEIEYEVNKASFYINMDRGKKTVVVYYDLPTVKSCPSLKPGIHMWKGHITYKPLGLVERRLHFETEKFRIKID